MDDLSIVRTDILRQSCSGYTTQDENQLPRFLSRYIYRFFRRAERAYARKIGVRRPPFEVNDKSALKAMREGIAAVFSKPSSGEPLLAGGWNASYAVRRMAWHVVDHLWEIEDRRS